MADGPVIQQASERALRHGFGVADILEMVAEARKETGIPIVLFSYFNPLFQFGVDKLAEEAKRVGIDGILVTDLAPEEAGEFAIALRKRDRDMIFLVAPTSTDMRLKMIADHASGFIYAVARAGVTGAREEMSADAERLVNRVRKFSSLPVAVGFGISKPEHVREVWRYADAAVVGSAIVQMIGDNKSTKDMISKVSQFARRLVTE